MIQELPGGIFLIEYFLNELVLNEPEVEFTSYNYDQIDLEIKNNIIHSLLK